MWIVRFAYVIGRQSEGQGIHCPKQCSHSLVRMKILPPDSPGVAKISPGCLGPDGSNLNEVAGKRSGAKMLPNVAAKPKRRKQSPTPLNSKAQWNPIRRAFLKIFRAPIFQRQIASKGNQEPLRVV